MRSLVLSLAVFGGVCAAALAQGQGTPQPQPQAQPQVPALNPQKDPLDWVLVKWEQSMKGINSLSAVCVRTSVDKVFKKKETYKGRAKYLRNQKDNLASLYLVKDGRPEIFEKVIITGTFLYQFDPSTKVVKVHDMPKPPPGQVAENSFLSFLFGMGAAKAKQRYHLKYVPPPANGKWYYYIDIYPKNAADKVDFSRARLVLLRSNFLPRQLWFEEPNGNEITWDFPQLQTPVQDLTVQEFQSPKLPRDWRMQRVPASSRPRIMRNQR